MPHSVMVNFVRVKTVGFRSKESVSSGFLLCSWR